MWILGPKCHSVAGQDSRASQKALSATSFRATTSAVGSTSRPQSPPAVRCPAVPDAMRSPDPGPGLHGSRWPARGGAHPAPVAPTSTLLSEIDRNLEERRAADHPSTLLQALDMTSLSSGSSHLSDPLARHDSDTDVLFDDHGFLLDQAGPRSPASLRASASPRAAPHARPATGPPGPSPRHSAHFADAAPAHPTAAAVRVASPPSPQPLPPFSPPLPLVVAPASPATAPRASPAAAPAPESPPTLVVFSGATAFNTVAASLRGLTTRVTHVLPVSDDGGSTAEIVRVLGGPAVGDIRSRCLRLSDRSDDEGRAVAALLGHRLPGTSAAEAKAQWYAIVEGDHELWRGVSEPYKHTIRAFLVHFQANIMRHSSERFDFRNGSVGNFFFAGARVFFRSLEAAIFLFSRVARLPEGSLVAPAILTEERITLGAELADGTFIRGQNAISHPPRGHGGVEAVRKDLEDPPMPARVRRVFYLSSEGTRGEHEVFPRANPRVLQQLESAELIVYGMGSLYTSVCPSLVLRGVGEAVAARACPKVLVLNGSHDRETTYIEGGTEGADGEGGRAFMRDMAAGEGGTGAGAELVRGAGGEGPGPAGGGESAGAAGVRRMRASDVVTAVVDALNRRHALGASSLSHSPGAYVTALVAPEGGGVEVDEEALWALGVHRVVRVAAHPDGRGGALYDPDALVAALGELAGRGGAAGERGASEES